MRKKLIVLTLALTVIFSAVFEVQFQVSVSNADSIESVTSQESQVVALVNGTNAYDYDLELEKIALNHDVSNYAFRSGGSVGANATATWIKEQFESYGLETRLESFEFTTWNLPAEPVLIIDEDGLNDTTNDQTSMDSFQSEHYSWPTPEGGVFADLVVLPLPSAANFSEIGRNAINTTLWNSINTHGKIVLVGREVRWSRTWEQIYQTKLSAQTTAAVIYTWWYSWMSFCPPFFSSVGGRPSSSLGPYYWNLKIPTGWVNYEDGLVVRGRENSLNVSAKVAIPSVIGSGPHYNVVGKLQGNENLSKVVIVSGHYDTVMTAGFVDNGAGTSGVLELARVFAEAAKTGLYRPNSTVLFIAFTSEELGLIGSSNYVRQHKAEMKGIAAVINLDCVGSDSLYVTETTPGESFDLDQLVFKAASDLNINVTLLEPGGSDQETFRDPRGTSNLYTQWWPGLSAGISDATPVESSAMLVSFPLFYSDEWNRGSPGWIHTPYDNSTSTGVPLNWLEPGNLEEHLKVAALSVMRVSPSNQVASSFSFPLLALGVAVAAVVVAVAVVYFVKVRKSSVKDVTQVSSLQKPAQ